MKNLNNFLGREGLAAGVLVGILAGIIFLGGIVYFAGSNRTEAPESPSLEGETMMDKKEGDRMMEKEGDMMDGSTSSPQGDKMMNKDGAMMEYSGQVLAGTSAPLLDFTKVDYEAALKTDNLIVLYFYANWCPICKEEVPKLEAAFNELQTSRVVGFRINYKDNETDQIEKDLAREFGVGYQHTKVFLKNGERVLKAPDSWNKDRYLSEISKFLVN